MQVLLHIKPNIFHLTASVTDTDTFRLPAHLHLAEKCALCETGRNPSTLHLKLRQAKYSMWDGMAQSFYKFPMGWTVQGSNSGERKVFHTRPDRPRGPPCTVGTRSLLRGKLAKAWP